MSLSFVQLNIESNYHLDKLEEILRSGPDVICLQEVFLTNLIDLSTKYSYHYSFSPCVILNKVAGKFAPLGEWGIAILTKEKQFNVKETYYAKTKSDVKEELNPPPDYPRAVLSVDIEVGGDKYTFATTHFTWAMPDEADKIQQPDLERLLPILAKLGSFVLSGDFNAPRGGLVQKTLANLYNYYIPESVNTTIDNKLHRAAPLYLVIDHLFATPDYIVKDVEVKTGYSDHCAIFALINKLTT